VLGQSSFAVPDAITPLAASEVAGSSGPRPLHQLALGQTAVILLIAMVALPIAFRSMREITGGL
jgi:hypothetical protein